MEYLISINKELQLSLPYTITTQFVSTEDPPESVIKEEEITEESVPLEQIIKLTEVPVEMAKKRTKKQYKRRKREKEQTPTDFPDVNIKVENEDEPLVYDNDDFNHTAAADSDTQDETEELTDMEIIILTKQQQIDEVQKRKISYNYQNSFYKCDKCFKGFTTVSTYKNHMTRHDPVSVVKALLREIRG